MSVKKKLMELMWRMQQSQTIIGVLMWSLTLAGIFYPYIRDWLKLSPSMVLLPLLGLFLFILGCVVLIGIIFDKLRFWKEQNIVLAERNPYASYKLYPKEIHWSRLWLVLAKQQPNPSPEVKKEIEFFEKWMARLMSEDQCYRAEVEDIEKYVAGNQLKTEAAAPECASK
jgi:hypothetical protein